MGREGNRTRLWDQTPTVRQGKPPIPAGPRSPRAQWGPSGVARLSQEWIGGTLGACALQLAHAGHWPEGFALGFWTQPSCPTAVECPGSPGLASVSWRTPAPTLEILGSRQPEWTHFLCSDWDGAGLDPHDGCLDSWLQSLLL